MSNGKVMIVHLIAGLTKDSAQYHIKMSNYFLKSYKQFGRDINVKVDLSNYATNQALQIFHMLILQVSH